MYDTDFLILRFESLNKLGIEFLLIFIWKILGSNNFRSKFGKYFIQSIGKEKRKFIYSTLKTQQTKKKHLLAF